MQQSWRVSVYCVLVSIGCWLSATTASAQMLAVQGDHFTVNGAPRFLVFVTYFDALDVPDSQLDADLCNLKFAVGVDGVRVLPNWMDQDTRTTGRRVSPNTVLDEAGNLRGDRWAKLLSVLDRARACQLVVDVSWTAETVGGGNMSYEQYKSALGTITSLMRSSRFDHVLFDLQNESDLNGPQHHALGFDGAKDLSNFVHSIDPARIVTASVDYHVDPGLAAAQARDANENVVAWHEKRDENNRWYDGTSGYVGQLRSTGRPVFLQEPPKFEDFNRVADRSAEMFLRAAQEAKKAGAAAWCYHTSAGQWMEPSSPNPAGGIWDRITGSAGDSDDIDRLVLVNMTNRLNEVSWGIGGGGGGGGDVVFYEHINFSGAALQTSGDLFFVGWDWNDRISSIHIPAGRRVILFQDWHFEGASIELTGDIADLRAFGWNDMASSIQIR